MQAYDVRPVVKEQVESLGARFVQLELSSAHAEGQGGYAKAMDEEFYRRQRELLAKVVALCDVVITTAAIPGAKAPVLVTADMVKAMPHGSIVVDLSAKPGVQGGNCELTRPDESVLVEQNHATVIGPTNLPATVPYHASQLYARNVVTLVQHLVRPPIGPDGKPAGPRALTIDEEDEITREILVTSRGAVVHAKVRPQEKAH